MASEGDDREGPTRRAFAAVDSAASSRFVVFGSLPPGGRDLDVVVPAAEVGPIAASLRGDDFEALAGSWLRFRDCDVDAVELVPAEEWGLAGTELRALFEEAVPLEAGSRGCRPAPHHALLIAARRAVGEGARVSERIRGRVEVALREDPGAFATATERAPGWHAGRAIAALERAAATDWRISGPARAAALVEIEAARAPIHTAATATLRRLAPRRPRRGAVIALSGLDGSGKSLHAEALAATLVKLGIPAEVVWSSVASHPRWLAALAKAIKRALALLPGAAAAQVDEEPGAPRGSSEPAKALRRRSRVLTFAWSAIVSLRAARELAAAIWPRIARGKVVVCDRYTLDSWVHLRYQYGEDHRFALQLAVLRVAAAEPRLAYLLDVAPATAAARKPEYDVAQNLRRATLYEAGARELAVRRVDAERPVEAVCAELAREAVAALRA